MHQRPALPLRGSVVSVVCRDSVRAPKGRATSRRSRCFATSPPCSKPHHCPVTPSVAQYLRRWRCKRTGTMLDLGPIARWSFHLVGFPQLLVARVLRSKNCDVRLTVIGGSK